MRPFLILLFAALCGLFIFAKDTQIKGSGPVVKQSIDVGPFHGIVLRGSMDILITRGDRRSVVVEAQSNIGDLLTAEVSNGICVFDTREGFSTNEPFTIHITTPDMDHVVVQGSGDAVCSGTFNADKAHLKIEGSGNITLALATASLNAAIEGSGDIKVSGTSQSAVFSIAGSGDVDARDLDCADVDVKIEGSGDVSVNATGTLNVNIAGSGDVHYSGDPKLTKKIAGSGDVSRVSKDR